MFIGADAVGVSGTDTGTGAGTGIRSRNPETGEELDPAYPTASPADVERACRLAEDAFDAYRATHPADRARFLERTAHH
ncbi:hypothetical protein C3486_29005, partial [Streptomyces sp. Ru73]